MSLPFVSVQGYSPKRFALRCECCTSSERKSKAARSFFKHLKSPKTSLCTS